MVVFYPIIGRQLLALCSDWLNKLLEEKREMFLKAFGHEAHYVHLPSCQSVLPTCCLTFRLHFFVHTRMDTTLLFTDSLLSVKMEPPLLVW